MEFIVSETEERSFGEFRRKGALFGVVVRGHGETFIVDLLYGPGEHRGAE